MCVSDAEWKPWGSVLGSSASLANAPQEMEEDLKTFCEPERQCQQEEIIQKLKGEPERQCLAAGGDEPDSGAALKGRLKA